MSKKNPWEGDEQGERIAEELQYLIDLHTVQGTVPSLAELEDVFEDRDPFEFL